MAPVSDCVLLQEPGQPMHTIFCRRIGGVYRLEQFGRQAVNDGHGGVFRTYEGRHSIKELINAIHLPRFINQLCLAVITVGIRYYSVGESALAR